MRNLVFGFFILISTTAFGKNLSVKATRYVFDLPKSAGTINRLQVGLSESSGQWFANVKSQHRDGGSSAGRLACQKVSPEVFHCRRMDRGGGFELRTSPKPKLTLKYFTSDEEGSKIRNFLRAPASSSLVVEGKRAAP